MIFSLERAAVVWAILERISGFDPSLEMIVPVFEVLRFFYSLTFYLDRSSNASHMILSRKILKSTCKPVNIKFC